MIPLNRKKFEWTRRPEPPIVTYYAEPEVTLSKKKNYKIVRYTRLPGRSIPVDIFTSHVEHAIQQWRPCSVIFEHAYKYRAYSIANGVLEEATEFKTITWRPSRMPFAVFVSKLLEMRYKDMFNEDYSTYDKMDIIGESIHTAQFTLLIPEAGEGSDMVEVTYSVNINGVTYRLLNCDGPDGECFYNVLAAYVGWDIADSLHEDLGVHAISELDLTEISSVLEEYGINIKTPNNSYGRGMTCHMMLYEGHWARVESTCATRPILDNVDKFVTYDFETVAGSPYMLSLCDATSSFCIKTTSPGCPSFIKEIKDHFALYISRGYTIVGFNNSKYDDLFMLKILNLDEWNVIKGNGFSVLTMRHSSTHSCFIDACKFLKTSLRGACKMLGIEAGKLDQDHKQIEESFLDDGYVTITSAMIEYSIRDVECLYEVWHKSKNLFKNAFGLNANGCISLSQMVYRKFKKLNRDVPQLIDPIYRRHIIGGKCDAVKGIHRRPSIKVYDVNSLYPYVMMTEKFICSASDWGPVTDLRWHGLYVVRVTGLARVCVLPIQDEILNWQPDDVGYTVRCSGVDLMEHMKYGGSFEMLEGYAYGEIETSRKMFGFLHDYYEIKRTSDDPTLRNVAKLLMNSLSGKLTQRAIFTEHSISRYEPATLNADAMNGDFWVNESMKSKPTTTGSLINGILVYSYARAVLNRYLCECEDVFYCDTDSVFTTSTLPTSDELGGMKLEATGDTLIVGGKKMYTLLSGGVRVKSALKGARLEGRYEGDSYLSSSDEWLQRAIGDGRSEFRVTMEVCMRNRFEPVFMPVTKTFKLD